jgi:hypothetical protein
MKYFLVFSVFEFFRKLFEEKEIYIFIIYKSQNMDSRTKNKKY